MFGGVLWRRDRRRSLAADGLATRASRPPALRPRGRSGLLLAVAAALLVATAGAQGISYTVQVVALSDKDAALELQTQLNDEGFPAYVVRSSTSEGEVFRLRVGAFANRQAALVFADAMPQVAGGRPVPALAEAIPPGIVSLAPRLITRVIPEGRELTVVPWQDGVALRLQQRSPLTQARYVVLQDGEVTTFDAWLAVPLPDGGMTRVRDLALWPEDFADASPDARAAYRSSVSALVADALDLPVADVEAVALNASAGADAGEDPMTPPSLVVVETFGPAGDDSGAILALGMPELGISPTGPVQYLGLDPGDVPQAPEGTVLTALEPTAEPLSGDGWTVRADGTFLRLSKDGGSSWRAGVGKPVWTDGVVLATLEEGSYLFYDFLPR